MQKKGNFKTSLPPLQHNQPYTPPAVIDAIDVAGEAAGDWVETRAVIEGKCPCQDIVSHHEYCSAPRSGLNLCTTHRVTVEGGERELADEQTDKNRENHVGSQRRAERAVF